MGKSHGIPLPGMRLWEQPGENLVGIWEFLEFTGAKHQKLWWEDDGIRVPGNFGVFWGFSGEKQ